MKVKVGKLPFNVSLSVKRVVASKAVFNVLCNVRFAGLNKGRVGDSSSATRTGKQTVIGKIILDGDSLGHTQIVTTALATVRDRFNSADINFVVHI
jgi:hypothetical protein